MFKQPSYFRKAIFIFSIVLIMCTIISCNSSTKNDWEIDVEDLPAEELPEEFPIPMEAHEIYGYTSGSITQYYYEINISSNEIITFYNVIDQNSWITEKDWFEQGDGLQKHFRTHEYNPLPGNQIGTLVQVSVTSEEDSKTKLIIVATNYD
ncbi:hypothetical protein HN385_03085 [archaeon]|jgi:hypothetical protein|nr:hypothetical protein [archaeon]MBT3450827.1 hypothetical protein [archaeon]MBT6868464.1 hypothetical protein [archaeon]MBT7193563.1 hypothetical protein [archaeon]MBT7381242.1 hypothetical protein [archaeon]